ncbi:MAG: BON domain-containing protein [Verrucomicrobiota bacterium]
MRPAVLSLIVLTPLVLTACRQLDSGRAAAYQSDSARAEGSTLDGLGRSGPFRRAGMADATIAASREEAALDVSGAGASELSRRAAAATAQDSSERVAPAQEVKPERTADDMARERILLALGNGPDAARRSLSLEALHTLNVVVKNGVVTLTGQAANPEERHAVEAMVRDVEGVKAVDNQLELATPLPSP